ncbi:GNAT family N-acetyltransferase [uncultured Litoreibacter sp.]|uniref:GNAT family N-acetyltransferase n=1 Tax=uncultured Litoreibacter sp. TaxID=1392394 RepID=UPI002631CD87|nr:GNAT family N-acetyltransferase [uncultured Litoreibacter sp.]
MIPPISFKRLTEVEPAEIADHMSDPRVAGHMPLLTGGWSITDATEFVAMKEACWVRDGLGHWAIFADGNYIGWGGFQKEADEWDFGLVLKPDVFGWGRRIALQAITFAKDDPRIPFVTFLLPPSRKNLSALSRLGARHIGEVVYDGEVFLKYRLDTV